MVIGYLLTGKFWFSAFLALLLATVVQSRFGYGRSGVIYLEAWKTKLQFAGFFVGFLVLANLCVAGAVALFAGPV